MKQLSSRLVRFVAVVACLGGGAPALALTTPAIIASVASPDCLQYRIVGICYWLHCTLAGCVVRTSNKIRHYIPDAVVSSYSNTGQNPWTDARAMSQPNVTARAGGDGVTSHRAEDNLAKFKNADVVGHPGGSTFSQFASRSGQTCQGAGTAFAPYFLSTLDTLAWRYAIPEMVYPEALTPGLRDIDSEATMADWGSVYPRSGFLHQTDDYESGAVVAQRAGDVVTRRGQPHVYQPLLADAHAGYWPAGALVEGDAKTGKWQELTPTLSPKCAVFPNNGTHAQATRGDYAWALWRPYACCERKGEFFLGSIDF
jgi:integrating conjugative element protein (TIGR03756 family)